MAKEYFSSELGAKRWDCSHAASRKARERPGTEMCWNPQETNACCTVTWGQSGRACFSERRQNKLWWKYHSLNRSNKTQTNTAQLDGKHHGKRFRNVVLALLPEVKSYEDFERQPVTAAPCTHAGGVTGFLLMSQYFSFPVASCESSALFTAFIWH